MSNMQNTSRLIIPIELYSSTGKIVGYSLAYGLIGIVALTGNLMVFMVMAMNRTMHSATSVLLLNLSMSDIFLVVFSLPGLLEVEICNDRWVLGELLAKLSQFFIILCSASSVFTMMAIALERYLAVVHPLKQMARKKKATVATAISLIWTCSIALSIPQAVYTVITPYWVTFKQGGKRKIQVQYYLASTMNEGSDKIYSTIIFVALIVVPILVLSYSYARIVWRLWNPDRQLNRVTEGAPGPSRNSQNFVAKARRKTTIMLIVILAVFFLCMFPYNIFQITVTYVSREQFDLKALRQANSVLRVIFVLNSATNPIIYNFMSEKFRAGFRNIFACHWRAITRVGATEGQTILA